MKTFKLTFGKAFSRAMRDLLEKKIADSVTIEKCLKNNADKSRRTEKNSMNFPRFVLVAY